MQASEHSDAITIKAPAKINPWLLVAKVQKVREDFPFVLFVNPSTASSKTKSP
jgi:hypothetical protein